MKNVTVKQDGNILLIEIDVTKRFGKSASGKNTIVASTEGNISIGPGITLGLNAYVKE